MHYRIYTFDLHICLFLVHVKIHIVVLEYFLNVDLVLEFAGDLVLVVGLVTDFVRALTMVLNLFVH